MRAGDGGEHGVAGAGADRHADARHVQETAAFDQAALQQGRGHQAGGRAAAQIAERVAVGAVLHEIQPGVGVVVRLHARRVHAFGLP
ncbi:hypothetical protein G6F63_015870 [Rhizopus arrhizus]|nr:hypothetical protein G6F63_015870 [Rhizopus arrhizus]